MKNFLNFCFWVILILTLGYCTIQDNNNSHAEKMWCLEHGGHADELNECVISDSKSKNEETQ